MMLQSPYLKQFLRIYVFPFFIYSVRLHSERKKNITIYFNHRTLTQNNTELAIRLKILSSFNLCLRKVLLVVIKLKLYETQFCKMFNAQSLVLEQISFFREILN